MYQVRNFFSKCKKFEWVWPKVSRVVFTGRALSQLSYKQSSITVSTNHNELIVSATIIDDVISDIQKLPLQTLNWNITGPHPSLFQLLRSKCRTFKINLKILWFSPWILITMSCIFSVLDEKESISDQHHLFQAQIEALSSNQSLLRSNLTHLQKNIQSLTDSVRSLFIFLGLILPAKNLGSKKISGNFGG